MYPRSLLGTIKGEARERIQETRDNTTHKPYVVEQTHSISIHTTLVFTPVQALRCRIIQTLPPAGRRAFACPNQDKSLYLFASPSGKGSTHTNLLVGVTPWGENTDNIIIIIMFCVSLLYFCARKQKTSMGEIPRHGKHTSTTPLHDSGTHSTHFTHTYLGLCRILSPT